MPIFLIVLKVLVTKGSYKEIKSLFYERVLRFCFSSRIKVSGTFFVFSIFFSQKAKVGLLIMTVT